MYIMMASHGIFTELKPPLLAQEYNKEVEVLDVLGPALLGSKPQTVARPKSCGLSNGRQLFTASGLPLGFLFPESS